MTLEIEIGPEMRARVEAIAMRSGRPASAVIEDALTNGHSLDWQEKFIEKVIQAREAADRGEFASQAEIDRVRNKYRRS